jgi:hypothetical protein
MAGEWNYRLLEPVGIDGSARANRVWRYRGDYTSVAATDDRYQSKTLAQILADDFFLPSDGSQPAVSAGDWIFCSGTDGGCLARVSAASTSTVTLIRGPFDRLKGTATWDPGSLVKGESESKEITVTGAALGDLVQVAAPADISDLLVSAQVTADDTVTVSIFNPGVLLKGSDTVDFASIADGDEAAADITVTGAALGDPVEVVAPGIDVADLQLTATVTAADTVSVVAANNTGGAVDLGSQTIIVRVGDEGGAVNLASGTWTAYVEKVG